MGFLDGLKAKVTGKKEEKEEKKEYAEMVTIKNHMLGGRRESRGSTRKIRILG